MRDLAPSQFLGTVRFISTLPRQLEGLHTLSHNLWWSWNPRVRAIYRTICLKTWIATKGNPVRFLREVPQSQIEAATQNEELMALYARVMGDFTEYMAAGSSWWLRAHSDEREGSLIAYFSAEFGLHETLQTYSGGLGVLAGDHLKSASDLGIPLTAVGLLYREGYFQQHIDQAGQQQASFHRQKWEELPVQPALDPAGKEVSVYIDLPGRTVKAKVWRINVGRVPLHLLDTDLPENSNADRGLTSRLYGGDQEMRIQQEYLLGIGGMKALRKLGIKPTIFHMNEGHSAFLSIERLREYIVEQGVDMDAALEVIRASSLFTTHTPVPAGHDRFPLQLMDKYFRHVYESMQLTRTDFMNFGLEPMPDGQQLFSMTFLAIHFSSMVNGVSKLHGEVSRSMMAPIWRDVPVSELPIGHITNGVHTGTWMSFDIQNLFDEYVGKDWRERLCDHKMWSDAVDAIPDAVLWETMKGLKNALVRFVHDRLRAQHARFGELPDQLEELDSIIQPDALTIGFARRFATYKRATLILRNHERLARILSDPQRPVQLIFAGKAHPADRPGQEFIRQIVDYARRPEFKNRLVFLENYDMNIGRRLTSGVDLWLNNPRRPLEASGTSGMKVPLNGGLNVSILDGWWPEAMKLNPLVGWAIGSEKQSPNEELQDAEDADHLYRTLEREIIPLYYGRDENGVPTKWIARLKEAMKTCGPVFCTHRMVSEYTDNYYVHGSRRYFELTADNHSGARAFAKHKEELRRLWGKIQVQAEVLTALPPGAETYSALVNERIDIKARVDLDEIDASDVQVEIYAECLTNGDSAPRVTRLTMTREGEEQAGSRKWQIYTGALTLPEAGEHGFNVRVIPNEPKLFNPFEMGLVRWAS